MSDETSAEEFGKITAFYNDAICDVIDSLGDSPVGGNTAALLAVLINTSIRCAINCTDCDKDEFLEIVAEAWDLVKTEHHGQH
jgi:hypothetical protein